MLRETGNPPFEPDNSNDPYASGLVHAPNLLIISSYWKLKYNKYIKLLSMLDDCSAYAAGRVHVPE